MKTIRLSLFIFIAALSISNLSALNLEKKRPTPEEIQERKWKYIIKEANLTSQEIDKTKPVFIEYENKIWNLHESRHLHKDKKINPNYEELNEEYIKLETDQAALLKDYHLKLKNILSPETLFKYYHAERGYKRQLIYEMQEHRRKKQHK